MAVPSQSPENAALEETGRKRTASQANGSEQPEGSPDKKKAAVGGKVEVRLQAAGDAPIMKTRNYNVSGASRLLMNLYSYLLLSG